MGPIGDYSSRIDARLRSCLLLASLFVGGIAAQEPEVLVEMRPPRVFEGESVKYSVTLNNCDDTTQPILPSLPEFQIQPAGMAVVQQMTFDGIKRVSIRGPRYEYVLTPRSAGEWTIPGPTVKVGNMTYQGQALKLQVLPPNEQDLAVLGISASRNVVYPMQPFTVRLTVALRGLPEPYTDDDPLRGTGDIPALVIPWVDDDSLPDGVKPDSPALRWLQSMIPESRRQVGFGINNLRFQAADMFSLFSERQRAMFRPEPRRVKRRDRQGRTVEFWEYVFERTFTASQVGPLSFGPATLKGTFASRSNPAGGVDVESVYAVAKPIVVEVRDVPVTGRPSSYIGAVGHFELNAELAPTAVKVGDPMTLLLRIHGQGTLENASAPRLDQVPSISENFKVYEATEQTAEGERRFTYSLRPRTAGNQQFPPIELAYFDFDKEQFVTMRTEPISIEVAESARVADQDITIADNKALAKSNSVEASRAGIFANIADARSVHDERVRIDAWLLSLGTLGGVFVVCGILTRQFRRRRDDPTLHRRRSAARRALATLQEAQQLSGSGSRRETLDKLSAALIGLISDAAHCPAAGLTPHDAAQKLEFLGIRREVVTRCQQQLEELDAARYGNSSHSLAEQTEATEAMLQDLLREFRQRKLAI